LASLEAACAVLVMPGRLAAEAVATTPRKI
jgi:hypothetical protein